MAEDKSSGGSSDAKTFEKIVTLLAGLLLLGAVATALLNYFDNLDSTLLGAFLDRIMDFLRRFWPIWKIIAVFISIFAIAGIIHNFRKLVAINLEEQKIYDPKPEEVNLEGVEVVEKKNEKWERVMSYLNSNNPSDWRLAIIEADVILEELLRSTGHVGESVGDMLKSVEEGEFLTINDAWEAHKVRNAIAHAGQDFQLNEREARRAITLFEKVFREFEVI